MATVAAQQAAAASRSLPDVAEKFVQGLAERVAAVPQVRSHFTSAAKTLAQEDFIEFETGAKGKKKRRRNDGRDAFETPDDGVEAARRLLRAAVGALPAGEIADVIDQLGKQIFERLVHVVVLKENAAHAAASTKAASSIAQRLVDADSAPKSHALEIYASLLPALNVDKATWVVPGCIAAAHQENKSWTTAAAHDLAEHVMAHCVVASSKELILVLLDLFARHVGDGTDDENPGILPSATWHRVLMLAHQNVDVTSAQSITFNGESYGDYLAAVLSKYVCVVALESTQATGTGPSTTASARRTSTLILTLLAQSPKLVLDAMLQLVEPVAAGAAAFLWDVLKRILNYFKGKVALLNTGLSPQLYLRTLLFARRVQQIGANAGQSAKRTSKIVTQFVRLLRYTGTTAAVADMMRKARVGTDELTAVTRARTSVADAVLGLEDDLADALYDIIATSTHTYDMQRSSRTMGSVGTGAATVDAEGAEDDGASLFFMDSVGNMDDAEFAKNGEGAEEDEKGGDEDEDEADGDDGEGEDADADSDNDGNDDDDDE